VDQAASATVGGLQGVIEVFNEALQVSDPRSNGRTTFDFTPFEAAAPCDILWTVTLDDGNPDFVVAVATTKVVEETRGLVPFPRGRDAFPTPASGLGVGCAGPALATGGAPPQSLTGTARACGLLQDGTFLDLPTFRGKARSHAGR